MLTTLILTIYIIIGINWELAVWKRVPASEMGMGGTQGETIVGVLFWPILLAFAIAIMFTRKDVHDYVAAKRKGKDGDGEAV